MRPGRGRPALSVMSVVVVALPTLLAAAAPIIRLNYIVAC